MDFYEKYNNPGWVQNKKNSFSKYKNKKNRNSRLLLIFLIIHYFFEII